MRIERKHCLVFLLFVTFFLAAAAGARATDAADEKKPAPKPAAPPGKCIFSPRPLPSGKDDDYKIAVALKCGEFDAIHARCYFEKTVGAYAPEFVRGALKLTSLDKAILFDFDKIADAADWEQMQFDILSESSDFHAGMSDFCGAPGGKDAEKLGVELLVTAAKAVKTDYESVVNETTGKAETKAVKTYDYVPMASGTLTVVRNKVLKAEPPKWDTVKNALRDYWPRQYAGDTFIDGEAVGKPVIKENKGFTTYTYPIRVFIRDRDGNELSCDIKEAGVKVFATGSIEIFSLYFDYSNDCR